MRRYKNWVPKIGSWKHLSKDLFCQFFPEHRMPHFWSPPWTRFGECWKLEDAAAHDLILVEADGKRPWQVPICINSSQGHGKDFDLCSEWVVRSVTKDMSWSYSYFNNITLNSVLKILWEGARGGKQGRWADSFWGEMVVTGSEEVVNFGCVSKVGQTKVSWTLGGCEGSSRDQARYL